MKFLKKSSQRWKSFSFFAMAALANISNILALDSNPIHSHQKKQTMAALANLVNKMPELKNTSNILALDSNPIHSHQKKQTIWRRIGNEKVEYLGSMNPMNHLSYSIEFSENTDPDIFHDLRAASLLEGEVVEKIAFSFFGAFTPNGWFFPNEKVSFSKELYSTQMQRNVARIKIERKPLEEVVSQNILRLNSQTPLIKKIIEVLEKNGKIAEKDKFKQFVDSKPLIGSLEPFFEKQSLIKRFDLKEIDVRMFQDKKTMEYLNASCGILAANDVCKVFQEMEKNPTSVVSIIDCQDEFCNFTKLYLPGITIPTNKQFPSNGELTLTKNDKDNCHINDNSHINDNCHINCVFGKGHKNGVMYP